jgi:hypothetical protein
MLIPEYKVVWSKGTETVASVWFLEPQRELWQLRVEDPAYLLRPSVTNGFDLRLSDW